MKICNVLVFMDEVLLKVLSSHAQLSSFYPLCHSSDKILQAVYSKVGQVSIIILCSLDSLGLRLKGEYLTQYKTVLQSLGVQYIYKPTRMNTRVEMQRALREARACDYVRGTSI